MDLRGVLLLTLLASVSRAEEPSCVTHCHGKEATSFGKSVHADEASCIDCHGAHGILPARDPRAPTAPANQPATCGRCHADAESMEAQGLPSDTIDRYLGSVHARALLQEGARGAPSCADCHGTHAAAPPGVKDIVQVCGSCHANTSAQFRGGPHFRAEGMSCGVCHGTHLVLEPGEELYRGDGSGHCGDCHREPGEAGRVIEAVLEGTERLRSAMDATKEELRQAKSRGLFLENEKVYLRESQRALVMVKPLAHSLDAARISKHLRDGLEHQSRTQEQLARKRTVLRDRKLLLCGIALVLLLLLGLLLVKLDAVRRLS